MAKKQKSTHSKEAEISNLKDAPVEVLPPSPPTPRKALSLFDFNVQAVIIALLAFVLYINTYFNEYAHDDGIVIVKNEYVQEGFAGLKGIFTKDAYDSYYRQLNTINQLAGGRYRPLSIATFAIEQQFFGAIPEEKVDSLLKMSFAYGIRGPQEKKLVSDMHTRHLFNVFWYMACAVTLLYFLRYLVLKKEPIIALMAAVIFTAHPLHTEVVANVKSRDEIMSLLFICLTFIFAHKYEDYKRHQPAKNNAIGYLLGALLCFFLAFLSKEYAISLIVLLPLSFYLFRDYSIAGSIKASLLYVPVLVLYLYIRIKVSTTGTDSDQSFSAIWTALHSSNETAEKEVLNNPYYFADPVQKLATEIATSLNYLKLLIFPHPLSADYSYNSIPYKTFSDWQVWLSILVHTGIIAGAFIFSYLRKNYKIFAFAFTFYILHLLLVNNIIFNIGATMGERLIFHSSVGFSIVVAFLLYKGFEKIQPVATSRALMIGSMAVITILFGFKTISRNPDWKNDKTLFMTDINVVPNSVLVNGNVAAAYISMADADTVEASKNAYLHKAIGMLAKAIAIHPTFVAGYLNQGIAYYKLGMLDSAQRCLDSVRQNYPNYPTLRNLYSLLGEYHMRNGWNKYGKFGKYPEAINEFQLGIKIDSTNPELWYNLGGAYFSNKQAAEAISAWNMTIKLNPNHEEAKKGMQAAYMMLRGNQPDQPNGPRR
ncbi:MAG: tetratricopeptide repeat protein [Taibaiella sp.]|nr:tetratricopeptide repeat protein [Taibaiella sp.]